MNYLISRCKSSWTGICNNRLQDVNETSLKKIQVDYDAFIEKNKGDNYSTLLGKLKEEPYFYLLYHFNKLFVTVPDLNEEREDYPKLDLEWNSQLGIYQYYPKDEYGNKIQFFPIDSNSFGNQYSNGSDQKSHNFHFTLESHTQFWFGGQELTFEFEGDDDVWVFLNGVQVIDLGGIHEAKKQKFRIDSTGRVYASYYNDSKKQYEAERPINCNINGNGWYKFDFFYMERHTSDSNLMISTNMEFEPSITIDKQAYRQNDSGDGYVQLQPNESVSLGDTIYYGFTIKNIGNVDLDTVLLHDGLLDLWINKDGVMKGETLEDSESVTSGYEIRSNIEGQSGLSALNELEQNETVTIIGYDVFNHLVNMDDVTNGKVDNTATVSAKHKDTTVTEESTATVTVLLRQKPSLTLTKKVEDKNGNPISSDKVFTINVKGITEDGATASNYNVQLMAGETVTIEDLDYGITYTVSEVAIPMYYSFSGMKIDNKPVANNYFTFTEAEGPTNLSIKVTNTKSDEKWWNSSDRIPNEILYNPLN